jgi:hypothetical protein
MVDQNKNPSISCTVCKRSYPLPPFDGLAGRLSRGITAYVCATCIEEENAALAAAVTALDDTPNET